MRQRIRTNLVNQSVREVNEAIYRPQVTHILHKCYGIAWICQPYVKYDYRLIAFTSVIRALLFDFGGTLDQPGRHWLDRFHGHYRSVGLDLTRTELDSAYSFATESGYRAGSSMYQLGMAGLLEFVLEKQFEYLLQAGPSPVSSKLSAESARRQLASAIANKFVSETVLGLEQSRQVLTELAKRYRLGVVSNFYGNLETVLTESGIRPLIEVVVDSVRVGHFKPDPEIYRCAIDAFGLKPTEIAMVGDSLDKDCVPCAGLGMRTVLLAPGARTTQERSREPDHIIESLDQLKRLAI